jgi:hypothetical protein
MYYNRDSIYLNVGRGSSVGIATCYGLDGPGIESRRGQDIACRSTPSPVQWIPDIFLGEMRPGRGVDHSPSFSADSTNELELYFHLPSVPA